MSQHKCVGFALFGDVFVFALQRIFNAQVSDLRIEAATS
jgi:hypothetical protein